MLKETLGIYTYAFISFVLYFYARFKIWLHANFSAIFDLQCEPFLVHVLVADYQKTPLDKMQIFINFITQKELQVLGFVTKKYQHSLLIFLFNTLNFFNHKKINFEIWTI